MNMCNTLGVHVGGKLRVQSTDKYPSTRNATLAIPWLKEKENICEETDNDQVAAWLPWVKRLQNPKRLQKQKTDLGVFLQNLVKSEKSEKTPKLQKDS